ncbi:MAG: 3-oxoacyl-[acyl-carrier-protein] reductase [Bryobacteraceae bacterium]|nr:3-oxoacyl-[acyl-carrier-protein] reductase [Bryobacteraceae bacterium]
MHNRVALVTGSSRGIGRAIALTLCREGCRIVVASPEVEKNEEVASEIRSSGGQALTVNLDLTSTDSIKEGFAAAHREWERVDILVNNAGITKDALAMRMKPQDWDIVLRINLSGAFFAIQQALPGMVRERWGRIVNIASVVGRSGNPGQANYAASKAGMIGFTKALAAEVASRNVTANCIAPGFIASPMTDVLNEAQKTALLGKIPAGRLGEGADVAAAAAYLASDEAGYVTGQTLHVNGGMAMI